MSQRPLDVLVLVDLAAPPPDNQDYSEDLKSEDWKTEANVLSALRRLGHRARLVGVHNDISPILSAVREARPDLVFNLCEAFRGDRQYEPSVVGLLELLNLPYTGASLEALALCKDKSLTKKILSYHRIRVPKHVVSHRSRPLRTLRDFDFPAFIKPLGLEASEGISKDSFADNEADCLERVRFLHEKLGVDAIIEEFIDGRELYVGVLGRERLVAFPPRELFFKEVEDGDIKVATFKAKWDDAYRAKYGIKTGKAAGLDPALEKKLLERCKKIYRLLHMNGYGRIDLRLKGDGEPVFLEANPNPSLASDDDFAKASTYRGLDYTELIKRIIAEAVGGD
jgi:D-alanine-D-alanine ligase